MPDQLVCNIKFYLYTRFFLGFYHEFQTSKPVRWLARCYCFLICACVIFCFNFLIYSDLYPQTLINLFSMEYSVYMLISLLKNNRNLLQYYKKTPLIDASACTYHPMRIRLVGYTCMMFLIRFSSFMKVVIFNGPYTKNELECWFSLFDFIVWFINIIGRSPLLFVFVLLYTRVRLMRQTLESNDFDCRILGLHHPRRYIQMYEAIMDGLEASNTDLKLEVIDISPIHGTKARIYRDREEIQKLFLFLKRNPFEYSLWRVVPLNVCSLLSFFSFTVTTIIAILQIQTWNI
ncbi:hypothetical protein O3G_MSEX006846 [Manduca sexta]|uniref:Gustatory receptor 25 n=1 Tax=Manduca sexta TaxID=7130 RepID=A0A5K8B1C1_MANSE|nr:hypothetical protein O3G_MSEX006846 [Manduca sexta]CUQ99366.1 TPA: Gustatory receptor 25 [Manduca sexta]